VAVAAARVDVATADWVDAGVADVTEVAVPVVGVWVGHQRSATAGTTSRLSTSSGLTRSTWGTAP
jgi:hypothetical protein